MHARSRLGRHCHRGGARQSSHTGPPCAACMTRCACRARAAAMVQQQTLDDVVKQEELRAMKRQLDAAVGTVTCCICFEDSVPATDAILCPAESEGDRHATCCECFATEVGTRCDLRSGRATAKEAIEVACPMKGPGGCQARNFNNQVGFCPRRAGSAERCSSFAQLPSAQTWSARKSCTAPCALLWYGQLRFRGSFTLCSATHGSANCICNGACVRLVMSIVLQFRPGAWGWSSRAANVRSCCRR